MNWIIDNLTNIIVVSAVAVGVILAIRKMHKDKKIGKGCCGCNGGSCANCRFCEELHIKGHQNN